MGSERKQITRLRLAMYEAGVSAPAAAREAGYKVRTCRDHLDGRVKSSKSNIRQDLVDAAAEFGASVAGDPWELVDAPAIPRGAQRLDKARPISQQQHADDDGEEEQDVIPSKVYLDPDDLNHFNLQADPFDDLDLLDTWTSPRIQYNERTLQRAILRRQIIALVGDVGSGKSTTLRHLHSALQVDMPRVRWMSPGNLDRQHIDEGALASAMLRDLDVGDLYASSAERRGELLRQELERRSREGEYPTLVIDEAHDLSVHGLVAIKRVWDSFSFNKALGVILCGQLTLRHVLESDVRVRELTGRTRILEIPKMNTDEIRSYLEHRLGVAGAKLGQVFDAGAIEALARRGAIAPLWVDALAGRAMQYARKVGQRTVNASVVARA